MSESLEVRRKRLRFRSWHRGMKEADLLLGGFADGHLGAMDQAELDLFVSPTLLSWHQSGELVVIVLLGGMGTLIGPILGAAALVLLEEVLGRFTEHWMFVLGPILVLVALFSRRGLLGWLEARLTR